MNAPHSDQHLLSVAAMDMIRQLVAFDTTSRESNLALIDWVRQYLHAYGIDSRLTFDDARRKANLFATVGPKRDGGCIVGEPTGMELVVAHKGKRAYRCRVRGFEAHSALTPRGVNAV